MGRGDKMKTSELIDKLQKSLKENGDVDVKIDVEARCFNYHLVDVDNAMFEDDEDTGTFTIYVDTTNTYFDDSDDKNNLISC
jgi:hypothetical protein